MLFNTANFEKFPSFEAYFQLINDLYDQGKTTGNDQREVMLNYTKLGIARTKRGLKTHLPSDTFIEAAKQTSRKNWIIITEAWCGDAANIIPIIANTAKVVDDINLRIVLRDDHPEIMEHFLTNGGKSIPIFIAMNDQFEYQGHWGPRPAPLQEMVMERKNNPTEESYDDFAIKLQKWYQEDNNSTLQQELIKYLSI